MRLLKQIAPADVWACGVGMVLAFALLFYIVATGSVPILD